MSYKIQVTKTLWLFTRNNRHVKTTPLTTEQYPREKLSQGHKDRHLDDIPKNYEQWMQYDDTTAHYTKTIILLCRHH